MTEKRRDGGSQVEELIRLAQDQLDPSSKEALQKRLAQDKDLQALYEIVLSMYQRRKEELDEILREAQDAVVSKETAESAMRQGLRIFDDLRLRRKDPTRLRGIAVTDSADTPTPAGVRKSAVDTRRLKYRLPEGEVHLELLPVSFESYDMTGIVTHKTHSGPFNIALRTGKRVRKTTTDEVNLFQLARVASGRHEIELFFGAELIGTITLEI